MLPVTPTLKRRILIVDDSTLVRAVLIKHVEEWFEFCEAFDGEEAWEVLCQDPDIALVITDLTMPKLDGYGLLHRIRTSDIDRLRELPVIVVSGSDDYAEHERAKAAGATDIITKSLDTPELLSQLATLSKWANTEGDAGMSFVLDAANPPSTIKVPLLSPEAFIDQAAPLRDKAAQSKKNFAYLAIALGTESPATLEAIRQVLQRSVRQTDCLTQLNDTTFAIATGTIHFDSTHHFAKRLYRTLMRLPLAEHHGPLTVSCGLAALSDYANTPDADLPSFSELAKLAYERAHYGLTMRIAVVGVEEMTDSAAG